MAFLMHPRQPQARTLRIVEPLPVAARRGKRASEPHAWDLRHRPWASRAARSRSGEDRTSVSRSTQDSALITR
jgi:hypothetical protein